MHAIIYQRFVSSIQNVFFVHTFFLFHHMYSVSKGKLDFWILLICCQCMQRQETLLCKKWLMLSCFCISVSSMFAERWIGSEGSSEGNINTQTRLPTVCYKCIDSHTNKSNGWHYVHTAVLPCDHEWIKHKKKKRHAVWILIKLSHKTKAVFLSSVLITPLLPFGLIPSLHSLRVSNPVLDDRWYELWSPVTPPAEKSNPNGYGGAQGKGWVRCAWFTWWFLLVS